MLEHPPSGTLPLTMQMEREDKILENKMRWPGSNAHRFCSLIRVIHMIPLSHRGQEINSIMCQDEETTINIYGASGWFTQGIEIVHPAQES